MKSDWLRQNVQCFVATLMLVAVKAKRRTEADGGRIVGGVETTIGRVPYLVNLRRNGEFICGGSILTRSCILTAAHCVNGVSPATLTVRAAASRLTEQGVVRQVEQSFVSPLYSTSTLDMDVAVIRLRDPLNSDNSIATIALSSRRPANNEQVKIVGWGLTGEYSREPPDQVRVANVRVVADMDCIKAYAGTGRITRSMFCATVPGARDSCAGDSGGPVVYDGRVAGIVSWGIGCARPQYPGVYTDIASRRVNAFIKATLRQNCA